jgi:pSer/pThr/pTyr-binding forkhead associated (FHA) protein
MPTVNSSISRRELIYKALAGLLGGALGWLPVELASAGHSLTEQISTPAVVFSYIAMALLSGLIGGFILAADGQRLEWTAETQKRFLRGGIICLALAVPSNYYSNYVFSWILSAGGWGLNRQGSVAYLVMGRVTSWMMMGAMLGAGVGIATLTPANVLKGAAGGWVGGFVGGITFDLVNEMTGGGLFSRLFGLSAIGFAIGLFIGLVQELTKAAWLTVEQGRLKGRQYRIESARAFMGRSEECPVGLFGDLKVAPRHAVIERRGADYTIRNLAVADGTFVNGNRIETVDLHDNDRINVGGYQLSFHLRQGSMAVRQQTTLAADRPSELHVATRLAGARAQVDGPCLEDTAGQRFPVKPGAATSLGRALDNDIVVSHSSVSRHHASIEAQNGAFQLKDLNSQNGTFVREQRVTNARLSDGDAVRFGDAPFTFRA